MLNFGNAVIAVERKEISDVVLSNNHKYLSRLIEGCKIEGNFLTLGQAQIVGALLNYAAVGVVNGRVKPEFASDIIARFVKYIEVHTFIENVLMLNQEKHVAIPSVSGKMGALLLKKELDGKDVDDIFYLSDSDFLNFLAYFQSLEKTSTGINYPIVFYVYERKLMSPEQILYSMANSLYENCIKKNMAKSIASLVS